MAIQGTRLETDEDLRQALLKHRPAARAATSTAEQPALADDGPPLFRPTQRPAVPVLAVLDDDGEEGESIRIRQEQFIIGRTEGDLVIPHDSQMSSRHMELRRTFSKEKFRWHLVDLKSTNGTYVRIGQALLQHGQEFILGRTRLRFDNQAAAEADHASPAKPATKAWQSGANSSLVPSITELATDGGGPRVLVTKKEIWLGKDADYCQIVLRDDPFVSARHARIRQDEDGRWVVENNKSVNGVWLRVEQITFKGTCRFLLGEQQFVVRIPS